MFQWCNKNLVDRWGRPALLWKIILFCLYFEVCCLTMLWAPVRYLMVSIEIVSIEWEGGWAIRWRDNITKYVVQTQHSVYHIKYFLYNRHFLACSDKDKWQYTTSPTHRIIFPYLSDRMKRSRTFFILSPRVLKFCMITPTHILNKIGGGQNLSQKVKYFSILIFVWKMVKSGKFWTKNGIPAFLAHNRR